MLGGGAKIRQTSSKLSVIATQVCHLFRSLPVSCGIWIGSAANRPSTGQAQAEADRGEYEKENQGEKNPDDEPVNSGDNDVPGHVNRAGLPRSKGTDQSEDESPAADNQGHPWMPPA